MIFLVSILIFFIYFNSEISDEEAKEFAKCEMYDLSGMSLSSSFEAAYSNRKVETMNKVSCESTGLPLIDQYQFDTTEGISSIVTDVRFSYFVNLIKMLIK